MQNKFLDNNDFDKYAREQDTWIYDNGWTYKGELFASYMLERFDKVDSGNLIEYLVMLRDDQEPNKAFILHGINTENYEIWSGFINTKDDYQKIYFAYLISHSF
jgi:hypothetical protein